MSSVTLAPRISKRCLARLLMQLHLSGSRECLICDINTFLTRKSKERFLPNRLCNYTVMTIVSSLQDVLSESSIIIDSSFPICRVCCPSSIDSSPPICSVNSQDVLGLRPRTKKSLGHLGYQSMTQEQKVHFLEREQGLSYDGADANKSLSWVALQAS
jgi:hypothetical protein